MNGDDEVTAMRQVAGKLRLTLAAAAALAVVGGAAAANGGSAGVDRGDGRSAVFVTLHGLAGEEIGRVKLLQQRDKVVVSGTAQGLAPGFHGFHIHAIGLCDVNAPAGPFTTAGGHYTGGLSSHGDHAGDMPSLLVTDDGAASASFVTDRFTLDELRDADGSAVMVHSGRDNFGNIPGRYTSGGLAGPDAATLATGDAGSRVACGVIG